jgi:uncharacterized membrane protein YgaE (UPF0421/DUF939 family)
VLPVLLRRPAEFLGVELAWRDQAAEARARLRRALWPSAQAAAAAGIAWFVAHDLIGHAQPFFAPIAAAISLSASGVGRARRIAQMVVGVMLGIAIGEAALALFGTGALQITAVVAVTMAAALLTGIGFFSEGLMFVNQAAASAILVVALRRHGTGAERLVDALVGGGVAAVIAVGMFPPNPLTVIRDAEREVLRSLAGALGEVARLLSEGTAAQPNWALAAGQDIHRRLSALANARVTARAAARIAPRRWRLRSQVTQEDARVARFDLLANASLSLLRAATSALAVGEQIPSKEWRAIGDLAAALSALASAPQPWPGGLVASVGERVAAASEVAPRSVRLAPVLAVLVRATGRDALGVLPGQQGQPS